MSLLERLIPTRHLDESTLAELWTAASANREPASHPHLHGCVSCRARYADLCLWLDDLRADANNEADAAFTAERLAVQQAQILRRLEASERPARVIAFPTGTSPLSPPRSIAPWWVTAAAVAGLMFGIVLGHWMDLRNLWGAEPRNQEIVSSRPAQADEPGFDLQMQSISDEALLSELELTLATYPAVEPLNALDRITPRPRDFPENSR